MFLTFIIVTYAYICFSMLSTNSYELDSPIIECSPTSRYVYRNHSFGDNLDARLLFMLDRSTSELLRTL